MSVYRFNQTIVNLINGEDETITKVSVGSDIDNSFINIVLPMSCNNGIFCLTDLQGKLWIQQNISKDIHEGREIRIDITSLRSGLYFYKIVTPQEVYSSPFVIFR